MERLPGLLGNADPLRLAQLMPGIQTNSELVSGLFIQGCDNAHNTIETAGAPIYNAYHLMGIYSIVNTDHYQSMLLRKQPSTADVPNHLGGIISLQPADSVSRNVHASLSLGLLDATAAVCTPLTSTSCLYLAARSAFINLLYGSLLKSDDTQMHYGFQDYNIAYVKQLGGQRQLKFSLYTGQDKFRSEESRYQSDTSLKWENLAASLQYTDGKMQHTFYGSHYRNRLNMQSGSSLFHLPSQLCETGYKGFIHLSDSWRSGIDYTFRFAQPQQPDVSGSSSYESHVAPDRSHEVSLWSSYHHHLAPSVILEAGLRMPVYFNGAYRRAALDPRLTLDWRLRSHLTLSASAGTAHQYIHQAQVSGVGMPVDFWFSASGTYPAQRSAFFSLTAAISHGAYRLSIEPYVKRLVHQWEYSGNIYDLATTDYDMQNSLLSGKGFNYGIDILLQKTTGRLTGWIGYSFGRSLRRFPSLGEGWFPSYHERVHDLSVTLTYDISKRLSLGTSFVYASGTPYTAPLYGYIYGENLICRYGDYHGANMPAYHRLDLSANWFFLRRGRHRSGLNFSIYNVYSHENALFYYADYRNGQLKMKKAGLVFNIIPSIRFFYRF